MEDEEVPWPGLWPSSYRYSIAQSCPTCRAAPGVTCKMPRKDARLVQLELLQAGIGISPGESISNLHKARQRAGYRHKQRDISNVPLPGEWEPGKRYDTLPD